VWGVSVIELIGSNLLQHFKFMNFLLLNHFSFLFLFLFANFIFLLLMLPYIVKYINEKLFIMKNYLVV
jgi:hypothetical protein